MATGIYARLSLDRHDGAGVERQLEDCRALVERMGWGPGREFVDNSISAFNGKQRPQYIAMLDGIRSGEINRVVAWHLDRLYRQPRELEDLIDLADDGRVALVTVHGDASLGTDDAVTMARVQVAFANKESRDKSRRIKRQKQQARENGQGNGGPRPLGWKPIPKLDAKTGKPVMKDGRVVMTWSRELLEPNEVAMIQQAVTDLLAGASLKDVARRWNEAGVRQPQARASKGWTATGVRQVVQQPRLAGLVGHRPEKRSRDGKLIAYGPPQIVRVGEGWPVIIERTRWEELQARLDQRGANGHIPRRRSLLTGLVTCATCGGTMVRTGARGGNGSFIRKVWRCQPPPGSKKPKKGEGHSTSIDAAGLEELLVEATFIRVDTASLAKILRERGREGERSRDLARELEQLDRLEDEAAASFGAGKLPLRSFEAAAADIQRRKKAVQSKLGPLTSTTPLEPYAGKKGLLRKAWPTLTVDQQRAVIAAALGPVSIGPAKPGRPSFDSKRVKIRPIRNASVRKK